MMLGLFPPSFVVSRTHNHCSIRDLGLEMGFALQLDVRYNMLCI